jgi:Fur family transcriptional regulator, ferric uptake regulator
MITTTAVHNPLAEVVPNTSAASPLNQALDLACDRLKAAGLRITQPRIAILTALIKRDQPATIEQIHIDLSSRSCDLVTVYRCLAVFEELGLVRRCYFQNGTSLYRIQLGTEIIYHVVNKANNQVDVLPTELANELSAVVKKIEAELTAQGYTNVSHMAEFFASTPAALGGS